METVNRQMTDDGEDVQVCDVSTLPVGGETLIVTKRIIFYW